jgi:hypothetical protein
MLTKKQICACMTQVLLVHAHVLGLEHALEMAQALKEHTHSAAHAGALTTGASTCRSVYP